jgi:hypothetical protein
MSIDLLSIEALSGGLSEKALDYLQQSIPEHHRRGVGSFVQAQRRLFNDHAVDLAAVLTAIASAPKEFNLDLFEKNFIEWLRSNGVSSSRITQLKGAIRIKTRAFASDSFYSQSEREMIRALEVEKAYLFGRLTFAGQKEAFSMHRATGTITLQQLRQLLKQHQYDPTTSWNSNSDWKPNGKPSTTTDSPDRQTNPSLPISMQAHDLALKLQSVVDQLLDIRPQWEGDHRVTELIDAQRLSELTNQLCAGRDLGWDF